MLLHSVKDEFLSDLWPLAPIQQLPTNYILRISGKTTYLKTRWATESIWSSLSLKDNKEDLLNTLWRSGTAKRKISIMDEVPSTFFLTVWDNNFQLIASATSGISLLCWQQNACFLTWTRHTILIDNWFTSNLFGSDLYWSKNSNRGCYVIKRFFNHKFNF